MIWILVSRKIYKCANFHQRNSGQGFKEEATPNKALERDDYERSKRVTIRVVQPQK
jgi:hypothetical protein